MMPQTTRELELIVRIQVNDEHPEYCGPGCEHLASPGFCRFFQEHNQQDKRLPACLEADFGRIFRTRTVDVQVPDVYGPWRQRRVAIRKAKEYVQVTKAKVLEVSRTSARCAYLDGYVWRVTLKWQVAKKRLAEGRPQ